MLSKEKSYLQLIVGALSVMKHNSMVALKRYLFYIFHITYKLFFLTLDVLHLLFCHYKYVFCLLESKVTVSIILCII